MMRACYNNKMEALLRDVSAIPSRALQCLKSCQGLQLPRDVPYVGMGASLNAAITLQYCKTGIHPYAASEYFYYVDEKAPLAVLLSQSGESSETLWNVSNFEKVVVITDKPRSSLATAANVSQVVLLRSGNEFFSATKSYINTLITLYCGLGYDPSPAVLGIASEFERQERAATQDARLLAEYMSRRQIKGWYILGSGPNYGPALQGALTLSETTKRSWVGLPVAQYDHGYQETANDSIVILLNPHGKEQKRIAAVLDILKHRSNALVIEVNETGTEEFSPLLFILRLNLIMSSLCEALHVDHEHLGEKITTVAESVK